MTAEIDWFKRLAPIVYPSAVIERALETEQIQHLDFEPECEGAKHPQSSHGHDDGPATYMARTPCGYTLFLCESRVQLLRLDEIVFCSSCRSTHPTAACTFTPIAPL